MPLPFVSVIIPAHNDLTPLSHCLRALYHQSYPYSRYEVIVVDNNSTADLYSLCQTFPNVRYCQETKPGNNAARNRGIAEAIGDIIAITDADCLPDLNWIAEGVKALIQSPEAGIIGGAIQFYFQQSQPSPVEYFDSIFYLQQHTYIHRDHYAVGANLFTHRQVLEQVGGFEERLLNLGDKEWGQRVFASGWQVVYCPDAIVQHPARATLQALIAKGKRQARANARLSQLRGEKSPSCSLLPMGWRFWCSVCGDRHLPTLQSKLTFIWVVHRFKWAIAIEMPGISKNPRHLA
jgi:GT2 family glycosyltransferase